MTEEQITKLVGTIRQLAYYISLDVTSRDVRRTEHDLATVLRDTFPEKEASAPVLPLSESEKQIQASVDIAALDIAAQFGQIDDGRYKAWGIDQMMRQLMDAAE